MPDIIDDVEDTAEEFLGFMPKPGGMIDRHRQERARREEAQKEKENIDDAIESRAYTAVKVATQSPEILTPQTFTIQSGGYAPVLPLRPYRQRATILVITAAGTVILCKDQGAAISGNGFTLPYGIPFPVNGRAQLYAFNNTAAAVQVSVMGEEYAPEKKS